MKAQFQQPPLRRHRSHSISRRTLCMHRLNYCTNSESMYFSSPQVWSGSGLVAQRTQGRTSHPSVNPHGIFFFVNIDQCRIIPSSHQLTFLAHMVFFYFLALANNMGAITTSHTLLKLLQRREDFTLDLSMRTFIVRSIYLRKCSSKINLECGTPDDVPT